MRELLFFDPMTVAIAVPNAVLAVLITACAIKKRLMPWPIPINHPAPRRLIGAKTVINAGAWSNELIKSEFETYARNLPIFLFYFLLSNAFFVAPFLDRQLAVDERAFALGNFSLFTVIFPLIFCSLGLLPIFAVHLLIVFGQQKIIPSHLKAMRFRLLISLTLFVTVTMCTVPLSQYWLAFAGLSPVPAYVSLESARLGIALSSISLSLAGFLVAFSDCDITFEEFVLGLLKSYRNLRLIADDNYRRAHLGRLSDQDLSCLTEVALRFKRAQVADEISHLMITRINQRQEILKETLS